MATADAQNRVYLFRLQVLIIDGGLLVLRNVLDQKLNNQKITLSGCLNNEKGTIKWLKGQNIITQVQYDLLYPPPGGQPPTIAALDITLIVCLLRNLKCCDLKRNFKWNANPNATDLSVEADICRLKLYRNEISHISTTTDIKWNDFYLKWTEIEKILLRLNISVPNLQQTVDDIKMTPLDPEAEERIQKEVDEWKKLEEAVELVKEDIKLQTDLISRLQNKAADLEKQIYDNKHSAEKQREQKDLNTQESIATSFGIHKPFVFCSGKAWEPKNHLQSNSVYKYGRKTKFTQGSCFIHGASVRTMEFKKNIQAFEIVLHNQIEIMSSSSSFPFAEPGDSGALVVTNEKDSNELTAIVILKGHMNTRVLVTPIYDVLNALTCYSNKTYYLKKFASFHFHNEDLHSGTILSERISSLNANINDLRDEIGKIKQGLASDLSVHKREIKDELQKQSDEQKKQTCEIKEEQEKQSKDIKQILFLLNSINASLKTT